MQISSEFAYSSTLEDTHPIQHTHLSFLQINRDGIIVLVDRLRRLPRRDMLIKKNLL